MRFSIFKKQIFLVLLLVIQSVALFSQRNYSFKTFNQDNGIIDNYIECMYEDSRGFIWIGTRGGLNRFDGHSFTRINLPKMKSNSAIEVGQHYVNALKEDSLGNLWIGTLAGVYVYSIANDTYEMYEQEEKNPKSLSSNLIEGFSIDKHNTMWVATRNGLNKFDAATKNFTHYVYDENNKNTVTDNYIYSILHDNANNMWIGALTGGLNVLLHGSKEVSRTYNNKRYAFPEVRAIFQDSRQNIWMVTLQQGIYIKYKNSHEFVKFETDAYTKNPKFFTALSSINEDVNGNIWIGSFMGGIAIYDTHKQTIQFYKEDMPAPHSICGNSIRAIYRDKTGNMWLCSHGGGVSLYSPIASSIATHARSPYINSVPGNIVSCFEQDAQGDMYIGTDGAGFSKYNPRTKTFTNFSIKDGFASDAILDIKEIKPGILAIASWNGALNIYNTKTKKIDKYTFKAKKTNTVALNIYGMYFDKTTNLLWCNTFGDGVVVFDCTTYSFIPEEKLAQLFPQWNHTMFSSKILFDKVDKSVWLIDGIVLTRVSNKKVHMFYDSDSTSECTDGFFCSDILQTKSGEVYVAAYSGFKWFDRKENCLKNISFPHCNFSDAKSLLEDAHGDIWVSTPEALFRYNPKDKTIRNMSNVWGMPHIQYYRKSAFRTTDGHLYFGSLKGFIVLHEDSTYTYNITPSLYITKLFINNIEQIPGLENSPIIKDITLLKELRLNHNQSFITIEFGVLNFIDNEKSLCKYQMVGFDKDWIYAGKERRATYTNIPPGTYTFLVSTTNSEGEWIETPHALTIVILPPWWKTLWFKLLMTLMLVAGVFVFIYLREKNIKETNKQLEQKVDEKTKELQLANATLLEQKNTIEQHYENLREQQLVIEIKNSQLQEALNTKNKLLTVIAHDFKNPLSTLIGFAKLMQDKITAKKNSELLPNIQSIVNSAQTIHNQMIEVLEWSVSKNDAVKYNPMDINIEILIKDTLSLIQDTAAQKNILIEASFKITNAAFVDPRMMSAIIRNLVINSIKFTPRNGKVSILVSQQKTAIEITVKDTGIGMNQEQIDRILSDTYMISEDYKSGFGLQLCKTFIKRNNGTLHIISEVDNGSSFIVKVPKGGLLEKPIEKKKEVIYDSHVEFDEEDSQRKMLVIDDNLEITTYLSELFSETFTVLTAKDGKEGLDKALLSLPEIILTDINMPEMDGKQLCRQLRSNSLTNHIPIILISAQSQPHEQIEGLQMGADDFIEKPFNANVLKQKVYMLLRNREKLIEHVKQSLNTTEKFNLPDSFDDKIIKEITDVIIENISNVDFKVDMLADRVGLSRSQLYRKTISVLGQSPNDYIKSLRLQQAVEMLKTGRYRISEIAYEVGFSDPGYFSSCFFEKYGIKPSDYGKMKE